MQPGDIMGDTKNPNRFSVSTKCCGPLTFAIAPLRCEQSDDFFDVPNRCAVALILEAACDAKRLKTST